MWFQKNKKNHFHIVLCEDKLFLPYYVCSIDVQTIVECINFPVSNYIYDNFCNRVIPIHRIYVFDECVILLYHNNQKRTPNPKPPSSYSTFT